MTIAFDQMSGVILPLLVGDEVVVYRNGAPSHVKITSLATIVNAQLGGSAAGLVLFTAPDLAAQKAILGIS